ncbi:MAG: beta galactosidase jelly roll domain-containing protein [Acidobacteriota bacterium]|nr:beta galactosidase jelly roll domain-containing protein [Acidobacteriota bacterium]
MSRFSRYCLLACTTVALIAPASRAAQTKRAPAQKTASAKTFLHKNWQIQSSCDDKAPAEKISATGFDTTKWHRADLPATVVGVLVSDKTLPDPNYGTNLKNFPGMYNDPQTFFANADMPAGSPFICSWWYRTEFKAPAGGAGKTDWLHFNGINYRANIWLNGQKVADAKDVAGTYRTFEFKVSKYLKRGATNTLAVEISAPGKDDLGITWVDWNPTPPDKNMGIWKEVFLTQTSDVTVRNPFVASKLSPDYKSAALTVAADLQNTSAKPIKGILRTEIDKIRISQPVTLEPGESKTVRFTPEKFAALKLAHPRLWWPYTMGEPYLYNAKISFAVARRESDSASTTFGIREVTSELTDRGFRLFKINGRSVLIRGAAWAPDLLLRWVPGRLDADLAYVHDMGMNTIRLEGRLDHEEFYEKTDRLGILVMPGWTCCDAWERWKDWHADQKDIAAESLKSQIHILRQHPSVFVWLNGSDGPPPAEIENMYLGILKDLDWPNPSVSSASDSATTVTGKSGVKMTGPYEYVPPVYWLTDKEAGGAHGYNTETSPGPAIPTRESLERFIPKDHLWPVDDVWNYHAGKERFTTINVFSDALNRRYGPATSLDDFERKSQAVTYDGQRAMFEAYARNKYVATGVIQWMLDNAWPSLIWHLYDYYMVPAGGYFGTKKANEPIHVQYSYDNNSVAVINNTYEPLKSMKVTAKIYNLDASEKGTKDATLDIAPDSATTAFELPQVGGLSNTYFLRLQLQNSAGKLVSDNFYWLSTKADTLDWAHKQDTVYTPQAEFGDLTGLATLPEVKLDVTASSKNNAGQHTTRVIVKNLGNNVAFMVHLRAARSKDGTDLTPILWEDNYFSLLPGEQREISATYATAALAGGSAVLEVEGFNIARQTVEANASAGGDN